MPSKTSSFNKEILLQVVRSVGWVSILYFIGLCIALPIRLMMTYSRKQFVNFQVDSLFQYDYHIQVVLLVVIPILMAVFLFRFLHVKQAADLIHSLPVKRSTIFQYYVLTGFALLIVPVVLNTILILLTHTALDLSPYFGIKDVLYWTVTTILMNIVIYLSGVFIAMMTGISAVQAVLTTYVSLFFPVGITLLIFYNLRLLLYGFPGDYYLNKDLEKYSPITYALMLDHRPLQWSYGICYFALAILLYVLSLYFYKKRKIEVASEAIAFSNLRAVFKYGVTTCVMLFGGVYFSEVQNTNLTWIIFGYCLGAVIGYLIAEMVLQKTWRIFGNLKGLMVYGVVVTVTIVFVHSIGFYENKLPKQDEIKSVILTNQPYVFSDKSESYAPYFVPSELESKRNINEVLKLHKQIIADKSHNQKLEDGQYEIAFFLYTLKDGSQISRQYRINRELYEDSYQKIHESKEYKQASYEIFHLNLETINQIKISSNALPNHFVTVSNSQQIAEAIDVLKQDILSESYRDERYFEGRGPGIEIFIGKERTIYLNLKPNYERLSQWLVHNDLYEQINVQGEDIEKIVIANFEMGPFTDQYNDPQQFINEIENQKDKLIITDTKQIEWCLAQASTLPNNEYSAVFYYKGENMTEIYSFDDEHAPDFIKQHFK